MVIDNVNLQETPVASEIENLLVRSSLYQVLSVCYLYPYENKFSFLKEQDISDLLDKMEDCYNGIDDAKELKGCLQKVQDLHKKHDIEELQGMYNRIVGHTIDKECPLYEGQYGAAHVHQQVQELADIQGFYRAFGLDISEDEKERCDHISVEMEFMQFLLYKQAYALEHHGKEEAKVCCDAQKKFLKEHLGKWVPLFSILFGRKSQKGFYFALSELTKEFMRLEMRLMGIETEVYKESDLNQDEVAGPPDECLACASMEDADVGAK